MTGAPGPEVGKLPAFGGLIGPPAAWRFQATYSAEPAQAGCARRALAQALAGHPCADDAALIASEFAANAVLHSASAGGGKFVLRAEISPGWVRVEVEDAGGPWVPAPHSDGRPHGLDLAEALTEPGNWGIDGDATGRVAWATLGTAPGTDTSNMIGTADVMTTDETDAAPGSKRGYWCACGWSGSALAAMQDHLDGYDDGTDAHMEIAELWPHSMC